MMFRVIDEKKADLSIDRKCALFGISASGYYAWKHRRPSKRQLDDKVFLAHIRSQFTASHETYGSPRIRMHIELQEDGLAIGRYRVARLMRQNGLKALKKHRYKKTTDSNHGGPVAPNVHDHDFVAEQSDRKWGADISYIWTAEGWLYLAVVVGLFSRRIFSLMTLLMSRTVTLAMKAASAGVNRSACMMESKNHSDASECNMLCAGWQGHCQLYCNRRTPVPPSFLGFVHGFICSFLNGCDAVGDVSAPSYADAGCDVQSLGADIRHQSLDFSSDFFGQIQCAILVGMGQQHSKLFASDSSNHIALTGDFGQFCSDAFQHDVSCFMAVLIIDALKMVQVDEQHCKLGLRPLRLFEGRVAQGVKSPAIVQSG